MIERQNLKGKHMEELLTELEMTISDIRAGQSKAHIGAELCKIGMALELLVHGPNNALGGLVSLTYQIASEFPEEWKIVQNTRTFPPTQGTA